MTDSSAVVHIPELLSKLDDLDRVSSKWIAQATGKQHKHVLRDVHEIRAEDGPNEDHIVIIEDSRGYAKEAWISLPYAILLLSRYNGPKSVLARRFVVDCIVYRTTVAPRLAQAIQDLQSDLQKRDEIVAYLQNDVAALAANQKRAKPEPRPKVPKRMKVPYLVATLTGFKWDLRKRAKHECEEWQWRLALIPVLTHMAETFNELTEQAFAFAEFTLIEKFKATEMTGFEGQIGEALRALAKDMTENSGKYVKKPKQVNG